MTSSKLRKHGPKDVSHRDDTEEIPAHGNPQVVQPTDVTILQGSEIPTLHDINNIRAVEEFFSTTSQFICWWCRYFSPQQIFLCSLLKST